MSLTKVERAFRTVLFATSILVASSAAHADPLIAGARIAKILNIRSAGDASFVILTEGGSGPCAGQWIYFYPTGASTPEAQKRAYASVLMAMAAGMRVDIESSDASCANAYAIFVYP